MTPMKTAIQTLGLQKRPFAKFSRSSVSPLILIALAFICFARPQSAEPVNPPPKGGYPNLQGIPQFGLIAEDVEKVTPDLVVRDKDGKVNTVRYEQINAMLLNEFLKEHKAFIEEQGRVKKLEEGLAGLLATVKEQAAQIEKVSAELQSRKPIQSLARNLP